MLLTYAIVIEHPRQMQPIMHLPVIECVIPLCQIYVLPKLCFPLHFFTKIMSPLSLGKCAEILSIWLTIVLENT